MFMMLFQTLKLRALFAKQVEVLAIFDLHYPKMILMPNSRIPAAFIRRMIGDFSRPGFDPSQ